MKHLGPEHFLPGAGKRTPQTMLLIDERKRLLAGARVRFFSSDLEAAKGLHAALVRYRASAWRRDQIESTCPNRHRGRLEEYLWRLLKVRDVIFSVGAIRRDIREQRAGGCSSKQLT